MEVGNIAKAASFKSFLHLSYSTAQKIGFSINDFFSVNVTTYLLKKSSMENFIFFAV